MARETSVREVGMLKNNLFCTRHHPGIDPVSTMTLVLEHLLTVLLHFFLFLTFVVLSELSRRVGGMKHTASPPAILMMEYCYKKLMSSGEKINTIISSADCWLQLQ